MSQRNNKSVFLTQQMLIEKLQQKGKKEDAEETENDF